MLVEWCQNYIVEVSAAMLMISYVYSFYVMAKREDDNNE